MPEVPVSEMLVARDVERVIDENVRLREALAAARSICADAADMECECPLGYYETCHGCPDRIADRAQDAVDALDTALALAPVTEIDGFDLPPTHRRFVQAAGNMIRVGPQGQMGFGEERENHRGSLYAHGGRVFFDIETLGDGCGSMSPDEAERTGWALVVAAYEARTALPDTTLARGPQTNRETT